jgi:hypothetical protein
VCITDVRAPEVDDGLLFVEHDGSSAEAWERVRDRVLAGSAG